MRAFFSARPHLAATPLVAIPLPVADSIRAIIDALGDDPVLWVTPVLVSTRTESNLEASTAYNRDLGVIAAEHPNITILDWQDIALDHLTLGRAALYEAILSNAECGMRNDGRRVFRWLRGRRWQGGRRRRGERGCN